jgi:hypothetical protein
MEVFRSDRGGENMGRLFAAFCEEFDIKQDFTSPNSSSGNSETYIGVLQDNLRASLNQAGMGLSYWEESLGGCVLALDLMPCAPLDQLSMYEHRTGQKPRLFDLHPLGAWCTAHIPPAQRRKGENRGREAIMLGPAQHGADGFRVETLDKGTLIHSRSVTVYNVFPKTGESLRHTTDAFQTDKAHRFPDPSAVARDPAVVAKDAAVVPDAVVPELVAAEQEVEMAPFENYEVLPKRVRSKPAIYSDSDYRAATQHEREQANNVVLPERLGHVMSSGSVPNNHSEAARSEEGHHWLAAEEVEIENLRRAGTFKKVKSDSAAAKAAKQNGVLRSRPVYDRKPLARDSTETGPTYKTDADGTKVRFKGRIVVKGFMQRFGTFGEVYAGTPSDCTNKMMFAHSLTKKWKVISGDVTAAFLTGDLDPTEYVVFQPPSGLEEVFIKLYDLQADEVLLCVKPLYGMKQAGARFATKRDTTMTGPGLEFSSVRAEPSLFIHKSASGEIDAISAPHVDDIPMAGEAKVVDALMAKLKEALPMTGGDEVTFHLKVDISRSEDGRRLEYSQTRYAMDIVKEAGMVGCRPANTPSQPNVFLERPTEPVTEAELKDMNGFDYPRIVAMLGWLAQISRPDLCESVTEARSYVNDYRPCHVRYVRYIVRYLAGHINYGLCYSLDPNPLAHSPAVGVLKVYVDSSFGRVSKSGGVAMLNGAAVAWWSKKQGRTARSSTDSEIIALDEGARRTLHMRPVAMAMGIEGAESIEIFEDNAQAEGFANDSKLAKRTKYIDIKFHAVRDDVKFGDLRVTKVGTDDNISDAMTKSLDVTKFRKFRSLMGVLPLTLNIRH